MATAVTTAAFSQEQGISPREYAQREGVSLQTAYLRCWRGQVPCRQVLGRYWVIFVEDKSEIKGG
jgi:hypothetical protein